MVFEAYSFRDIHGTDGILPDNIRTLTNEKKLSLKS